MIHHRWHPLNDVFVWLSKIGTYGLVWLVIGLVVALVWRRVMPFALVVLAVAAADGIATLLKVAIGGTRPSDKGSLVTIPHSHSFPSGHTAVAFAAAVVLSWLVPRAAPAFFVLALAIGYSRIYIGVHWPLDVVGGAVTGLVTALLLLAVARRRSVRLRRSG
ncbi:MAG: undecaprenyl-diphosphatase [Gaiellaceae bacterium]|nr:undecaprenyl-diphosphatase [Gaiellaceae bacterium]